MIWRGCGFEMDLSRRGAVMGILNVTLESFFDGGKHATPDAAVARGMEMIAAGADIIDIGGESTRPGAEPVPEPEEMRRVLPVVERLAAAAPGTPLSIDTSKPAVARAALAAGAKIVNDVTGLADPAMVAAVRQAAAAAIVMHMRGTPRTMQADPRYEGEGGVVGEVSRFFRERLDTLTRAGIAPDQIAFDPGIGFGKTVAHNLHLLRAGAALCPGGRPLAVGVSMKSFIGQVLREPAISRRHAASVALTGLLRQRGARIFRVHRVRANVHALRMTEAILDLER